MKNSRILPCLVAGLVLIVASGCASSASNLKPESLGADDAAFFGRVKIVNRGEDVTSKCYVNFTDSNDSRKTYVNLDDSGWVFTAVKPGPTYLSFAICTLGGLVKYNATFETRALKFDAPGKGKLAYFGDVTIDLNFESSGVVAATVLAGSVGNAIASGSESNRGHATVDDRFAEAEREYRKRFGKSADALKATMALAAPKATRVPASK